jgi:hypothetical protein
MMIWPTVLNVWHGRPKVCRLVPVLVAPDGVKGTLETEPAKNWRALEQPAWEFLMANGAPRQHGSLAPGLYACPPELSGRATWGE